MNYKQLYEYLDEQEIGDLDTAWLWRLPNGMHKFECYRRSGNLLADASGLSIWL